MSHINTKKPCTGHIADLGRIRDSRKNNISPDVRHMLGELENYLRYERRLSEDNITCILRDIRYLAKRYDLSEINAETARRIDEDMHTGVCGILRYD